MVGTCTCSIQGKNDVCTGIYSVHFLELFNMNVMYSTSQVVSHLAVHFI